MKEGRGETRRETVAKDATRGEGRGGGQSRKRGKWKMHFFFVVGAHARAIVSSRYLTSILVLSNGNKTSE